eukprot:Gb_10660 [translate_table: standard]
MPSDEEVNNWWGQEWELYLENLPKKLEASQHSKRKRKAEFYISEGILPIFAHYLQFGYSKSNNWEVKVAFLTIVAYSRAVANHLRKREGVGQKVYKEAKDSYHPIAQGVVESLLAKYT